MNFKLKIYKHTSVKTNIQDDIEKILPYFRSDFVKQYIDVTFTIDVEKTRVKLIDATNKLIIPSKNKYDIVMYVFERGAFKFQPTGLSFLPTDKVSGIYLSVNPIEDKIDYTWKCMVHEILHSLVYLINPAIKNVLDNPVLNGVVTPYYGNENPYLKGGNFEQQLKLISDFFKPVVVINRITDDGVQTLGNLIYDNFKCKTLERPWKENKSNISCIPKGIYNVVWSFSPKFMKWTYLLEGTGRRTGIRIHSGNYWFDIQGCILLGDSYKDINKDGRVDILNSRLSVTRFEELLSKRSFTLVIQ